MLWRLWWSCWCSSNNCKRTQSIYWYAAGTQCSACKKASRGMQEGELRERKRKAQQAEQKGKQSITQAFAAAAAKTQKKQEDE